MLKPLTRLITKDYKSLIRSKWNFCCIDDRRLDWQIDAPCHEQSAYIHQNGYDMMHDEHDDIRGFNLLKIVRKDL